MEQPPTYSWRWGSSPWRDYKYNKSASNAEEEEEEEEGKEEEEEEEPARNVA